MGMARLHIAPDNHPEDWRGHLAIDNTVLATPALWRKSIKGIRADLKAVQEVVKNPKSDFFSPMPHAKDYTVFREILLVADHNAYHVAELVSLRRVLNIRPMQEY